MTQNTILLIILAAIIALMMAFFQYYYKNKNRSKTNLLLTFLRFLSIFSLFVLLVNPKIKSNTIENIEPILNVLVDNSKSITYANEQDKINTFVKQIKGDSDLNKKFDINYYAFSDDLYTQDTFWFNDSQTNIVNPLQKLQALHKDNIAPTILITDGNQTQGANYAYYKSKNPIYTVVVGDTLQYDDLKISQINVNSYANLNNNFPVEVFVQYNGDKTINQNFTVSQNGNVVFKKLLTFSDSKSSQKIQFNLNANAVGVQNYSCSVTTLANEKNTVNNRKNFSVEVVNEQAEILVLSTVNHPDIGMLKRSISSNKQHKIVIENNLNKDYKYKEYQLVILYQPNNKFNKIFKDIETAKAHMFIITGPDTDWNFLNNVQPFFTKNYVSKKENYVPIFNTEYDEFITEDIQFSEFTPLKGFFGEVKFNVPHKTILYQSILNFETENPLLATFSVDGRRGAILLGSDIWKWRMQSHLQQNSFQQFDNFFNKLIQYLSSTRKYDRLEIEYQPFNYANQDIVIKAQFFDATYVFDNSASLVLSLTNKSTNENTKIPFTLKNNHYEVVFKDLKPGDYSFSVQTEDRTTTKYGSFSVLSYDIEQQLTTANATDLKLLAASSDGYSAHIYKTELLIEKLLQENRYKTIQKSKQQIQSLIDWKWLLALTLLSLTLEWFIRKYYGKI
ncbi:VWA domain-containing protein [Aureibaculum sp. 2210JD6-5]|uniref:VWA domain-containing protein n=1 Tax=Aureibaculum sp. 2210JD6-5 TaxID=3103957 RepID=UPI002AADEC9F|nr:VWA domain-containing protein [Aureibaculum sp. 2210JD6-5]MDY7396346.1 VWA domain-containing protein [Aureibaculum sp. 2210JD6-5]